MHVVEVKYYMYTCIYGLAFLRTTALLPVAFITVICKDTDTDTYITTSLLPVHLLPRSVKIQILMTLMRQIYN